jgi:photosystem II stability/assembly factor-like uncharacterized protein
VRGYAVHGRRLYAAVEVGGLLRSNDAGDNWALGKGSDGRPKFGRPPTNFIHPDVHSVAVHPSSADLVFAPTGGGFYTSTDGGGSWACRYDNCYVRAVWVNPTDVNHLILGPAQDASGKDGRIEQSTDGGHTWHKLSEPQPHNMVERFYQIEDQLLAVMSNGQLWASDLETLAWQVIMPDISGINAIATI